MIRASITVRTKDGIRYDANHLSILRSQGPSGGAESILAFVVSGSPMTLRATDVEAVEFSPIGAQYCSECEGSIWNIVGSDLHRNP